MVCDVMGWDWVGWDGRGCDGMVWYGMGESVMGQEGMGWGVVGWDGMGEGVIGWDGMRCDVVGWMHRDEMGWNVMGHRCPPSPCLALITCCYFRVPSLTVVTAAAEQTSAGAADVEEVKEEASATLTPQVAMPAASGQGK